MLRTIAVISMVFTFDTAVAATAAERCDAFGAMAVRGDAFGQTEFAYCLLRGIGRAADVGQAIELLESAQAKGLEAR